MKFGAEFSKYRNISRYAVMLFIVEFVRGAYLVSFLPAYATDRLGFSVSVVGIAVSVHYFSDTIVKCFAGYLLDRFPLRFIVQIGLLISLAGLWAMHNVHSQGILIAASAVFGIGVSPLWLVCLGHVKEEQRAAQMGLLYTVWLAGLGLGPVAINFLMDRGYTLSFWFLAGVWAAGWMLSLRMGSTKAHAMTPPSIKKQVSLIWSRLRMMGPLFPGMVLQTAAAGMLLPILPGFATNRLGLSHSEYSFILVIGGAVAIIFLVPLGKLSDLWGRKWFLVCGFGGCACVLYGLTLVSTFAMIMVEAAVLGFSYAAVLPAWNALLARYIPQEQQGMGWGLLSSVEGLGIILGPMIGGWLAAQYNESLTILISALILAGIAFFYFFFPSTRFQGNHIPNQ